MVECLLDQEADINLQDDKEVILHTNAEGTLRQLAGATPLFIYSAVENKILSLQAPKLGSDLQLA